MRKLSYFLKNTSFIVLLLGSIMSYAQTPITIHAVERQRDGDNKYDEEWLDKLKGDNLTPPPFDFGSKDEMVESIVSSVGEDQCIGELNIYGHGNEGIIHTGNGQSSDFVRCTYINSNQSDWENDLAPIVDLMCDGATINLIGCNVGAGEKGSEKLWLLTQFFLDKNVKIRAPVNTTYGGQEYDGPWQECGSENDGPPEPIESTDRKKAKKK